MDKAFFEKLDEKTLELLLTCLKLKEDSSFNTLLTNLEKIKDSDKISVIQTKVDSKVVELKNEISKLTTTDMPKEIQIKPVRVYIDGVFDIIHR